jgi:hypothetical protein
MVDIIGDHLWLGYLLKKEYNVHTQVGGGRGGSKMLMWHRCDALFVLVNFLKIKALDLFDTCHHWSGGY